MAELESRIQEALDALAALSDGEDLALGRRRQVAAALPDFASRLRVEVGALQAVTRPRVHGAQVKHATKTIETLEHVVLGRVVAKKTLHALVDEGIALAERAGDDAVRTSAAFAAAAAAESALVGPRASSEIDGEERDSADPLDNDASFFVACVHAGGPPSSPTSDPARRRAFWEWWLTALVPWARTGDGELQGPGRSSGPRQRTSAAPASVAPSATKHVDAKGPSRTATWKRDDDGAECLTIEQTTISNWALADDAGFLGTSNAPPSEETPFARETFLWSVDERAQAARVIARGASIECVTADRHRAYYWSEGAIHSIDRHGAGASVRVASDATLAEEPRALKVDESSVYWLGRAGLYAADKDGGDPRTLLALGHPCAMALGAEHVYVSELDKESSLGAGILQIPKAGGGARLLVRALSRKIGLRADELFWTDPVKSKTRLRALGIRANGKPKPVDVIERPMVADPFGTAIPMDLLVADGDVFVVDCRPGGHVLAVIAPSSKSTTRESARFGLFNRVRLLGMAGRRLYVSERERLARFAV